MTPTPQPAVVDAFNLVANHDYTARHACDATGCSYTELQTYIRSKGHRLASGRSGGLTSTIATKKILATMLVCARRDLQEVAATVGVHHTTLYRWVRNEHMTTQGIDKT